MWTLTYNAVEKSLADWGLDDLVGSFFNQSLDSVDFRVGGRRVDAAILFPYGAKVVIKKNRTKAVAGGAFSGGSIWFTGWVRSEARSARPRSQSLANTLAGPWWYLRERSYEQTYQRFAGYTTPGDPRTAPVFETVVHPRVFLNQTTDTATYPTGRLNTGQQITDILNWALKPFVDAGSTPPFQIGTVDLAVNAPIDEVPAITCEQAIQKELRWSAGAVAWFDYTTAIPTLHVRDYANLTAFDLDKRLLKPTSLDIRPRYDRQRSFVRICYELNNDIEGTQFTNIVERVYPDPIPAGAEAQFAGLTFPINLRGTTQRTTEARLECAAINFNSLQWWLDHEKSYQAALGAYSIAGNKATGNGQVLEIELLDGPTVTPPAGEVDLGLPRELVDGTPADWMTVGNIPVETQKLKVTQKVRVKYKNGGELADKTFSVDVNTTNAITDTYTEDEGSVAAEPIPVGLEQQLYTNFSRLPWEGSFELVEQDVGDGPGLGTRLNILGGLAAWATMGAVVQSYTESIKGGRTQVQFGWPEYLNAGDLVALLRVARNLNRQTPVSMRSGSNAGGGRLRLGRTTPRANSENAGGNWKSHVASEAADGTLGRVKLVSTDPASGDLPTLTIEKTTAANVRDASKGAVELFLSKTLGKKVEFLEVKFTDETGATKYTVMPLATPYAVQAGAVAPIVFAGGGSGGMNFRGDYNSGATYAVRDVVVVRSGSNAGTYICVTANPGAANPPAQPDTGSVYWVSLSNGATKGDWL